MSKLALGGLFVKSENATLDAALAAIARAVELGVNDLDTAPAYGDSEEVVGRAWAALPDGGASLVVSTKLGGRPTPFDPRDVGALRGSVEESLRLLGRESIDLLMVHEPDRPRQHDW